MTEREQVLFDAGTLAASIEKLINELHMDVLKHDINTARVKSLQIASMALELYEKLYAIHYPDENNEQAEVK